ncbi:MAG TPA: hypothetical protein VN577_00340 [Terriglobales bacterium]|nr:hypothetical protein [Terriglobales bacterium]
MPVRTISIIVLVICGLGSWTLSAQSIAEAAKKKPAKKASRVITNDEIPPVPAEQLSAPSSAASGTSVDSKAEQSEASTEEKKAPAASESADVKELNGKLETLKKNMSERQARSVEYREKANQETNEFRRNNMMQMLAAMEFDLKNMDKQREQLEKEIADKQKNEKPKEEPKDGQ